MCGIVGCREGRQKSNETLFIEKQYESVEVDSTSATSDMVDFPYDSVEESLKIGIGMYTMLVDGQEMFYLETEEQCQVILENLKQYYSSVEEFLSEDHQNRTENVVAESVFYGQDVEVVKVKRDIYDFDGYLTETKLLEQVINGKKKPKIHIFAAGENFWDIAESYNITVIDLLDHNPTINEKRIKIGTELIISFTTPIIDVLSIKKINRVDELAFGHGPYIKTDDYFVGDLKIKSNGVHGKNKVIVEVYTLNGRKVGEKVIESTVLVEPIDAVYYVGTKEKPVQD